ncbi:hypothetical protein GCM10009753_25150 [Streptantibioticus ferralitis]
MAVPGTPGAYPPAILVGDPVAAEDIKDGDRVHRGLDRRVQFLGGMVKIEGVTNS